jgi:hypothetical protein
LNPLAVDFPSSLVEFFHHAPASITGPPQCHLNAAGCDVSSRACSTSVA